MQQKTITFSNIRRVTTLQQKAIGLLGSSQPKSLYFQTRWGIHTLGMKYPIDVVILDDTYIVKAIKQNLKPWRIFLWNPKYKHVFELPEGTIKIKQMSIGDSIIMRSER